MATREDKGRPWRSTERVAVALHVNHCQEAVVKKVWRFDSAKIQEYSREGVERELASLFPDVSSRHLRLELWYLDELVGQVLIESDGDTRGALTGFVEAAEDKLDVQYRTIHIRECTEAALQRDNRTDFDHLMPHSGTNSSPKSMPGATCHLEEDKVEHPAKKPKIVGAGTPVDLHKVISKCRREEDVEEDEQPLYVDLKNSIVRCKWCSMFKGSTQPRVLNQHLKRSKFHLQERRRRLNLDELPDPFEATADGRGSLAKLSSEQDSQITLIAGEEEYPSCSLLTLVGVPVKCQGLYDRRFESLHSDGSAGTTTPKKLWEDARKCGELETHSGSELRLTCDCCSTYSNWKKTHPKTAGELQCIADTPYYYQVCNEEVEVFHNGQRQVFWQTIRALSEAPKGACTGIASTIGQHPYTCEACDALQHGKSSQLLRRLSRVSKQKQVLEYSDNGALDPGGAVYQAAESPSHEQGTTDSSTCGD